MKKSYPLRVEETIFDKFQFVADKNHRSIAGHIAFLMEQAIIDFERQFGEITLDIVDQDE